MRCPTCKKEMRPLFYTQVCDNCSGLISEENNLFEGYVVFDLDHTYPRRQYVFYKEEFAKDWASMRPSIYNPQTTLIKKVYSYYPFNWRNGVQRTAHLVFADTIQTVLLDDNYTPSPGLVHIAP